MSSMNRWIGVGNVGNVEVKEYEKNGEKKFLVQVSVATSDGYKDKNGEWKNATEWHKCIFAIPSLAERAKSISKGDTIGVEGSIKTNKWTDKDGNDNYSKEIAVTSFKTWRKSKNEEALEEVSNASPVATEQDDDLPF